MSNVRPYASTVPCAGPMLLMPLLSSLLSACVATWGKEMYSFRYVVPHSEGVDVLDWEYTSRGKLIMHPPRDLVAKGHVFQGESTSGFMPIGDLLCVKWRCAAPGGS